MAAGLAGHTELRVLANEPPIVPTPVAFESSSDAEYLTADGRSLCLGDKMVVGQLDLRFEHRSATDKMPTDVVACDLSLADARGAVWKATSRCTTEVFMRYVHDFSAIQGRCFGTDYAPEEFASAIAKPVLDDARFSSDDRFYRQLLIDGKVYDTKFYYTTVHFDVGMAHYERVPTLANLAVRVRNNSLMNAEEDGEFDAIIEFGYMMEWHYLLLSNTAAYSPSYGRWRDVALPMPLVFSPTGETGDPQPGVVVR